MPRPEERTSATAMRNLFRATFEQAPIGIAHVRSDGRIIRVNSRFCCILGTSADQVEDHTVRELAIGPGTRILATVRECRHEEVAFRRSDGARVWVDITIAPFRDEVAGSPDYVMCIEDVTGRKALEAELRTLNQELEQRVRDRTAALERSNEDLEQFAYVASHDLQEPLRMVACYMDLLQRRYGDALDHSAREFIAFAMDGAVRMKRLIGDLLSYSRLSMQDVLARAVDLEEVLDDVRDDLQLSIHDTGAEISAGPLPTVLGDPTRLHQLLQNVIANSLKYRSDRRPCISVTAEEDAGMWRVAVADNGIGIDRQHSKLIFGIFQRLHDHKSYDGTGIGLASCKRIVELHGGRIWVESVPGVGSTFFFTLPPLPAPIAPEAGQARG